MKNETMTSNMQKAINFAQEKNPIWPFATLIVDEGNKPICIATDCAHISPLYHSEALVIHALIGSGIKDKFGKLTLFSTAEPDTLSQSAIYWAKITHDIEIAHICYGVSLTTIKNLWKFGIDISSQEIASRSHASNITFSPSICEKECVLLFQNAKERQQGTHPARGLLSNDVNDFYKIF